MYATGSAALMARHDDPCVPLCRMFAADAQGNGANLCDPIVMSTCQYDVDMNDYYCSNLFWAVADNGSPGFDYSIGGLELTIDEAANPVTCSSAYEVVSGSTLNGSWRPLGSMDDHDASIFDSACHVITHVPMIRDRIMSTDLGQLNIVESSLREFIATNSSRMLQVHHGTTFGSRTEIFFREIMQWLIEETNSTSLFATRSAVDVNCVPCNITTAREHVGMIPLAEVPSTRNGATTIETVLNMNFAMTRAYHGHCPHCDRFLGNSWRPRRLVNTSEILTLYLGGSIWANIMYSQLLDVSNLPGGENLGTGGSQYSLVALVHHLHGNHIVDFKDAATSVWYRATPRGIAPIYMKQEMVYNTVLAAYYARM